MRPVHQEFTVRFRYSVHFTDQAFAVTNRVLRNAIELPTNGPGRALFVLDAGMLAEHPELPGNIERYCRRHQDRIELAAPPLVVPGGEAVKNDELLITDLQRQVERHALCRQSYIVAVGGGAVLDAVGYAAATAHRGIRLIRVPTTVLAQNDAGLGVKNGINAFGRKNFTGTFAPPFAVINDSAFLPTLSERDWRAGVAEAVKVALVRDAEFFVELERSAEAIVGRDLPTMRRVIYRCAELHLAHIRTSGDPFENGSARPLDFGHWAAHKLEQLTSYRLRHGEAVAIGIALDTTYSRLSGRLGQPECERVLALLEKLGFALHVPEMTSYLNAPSDRRSLLHGLQEFREHLGGTLTITLLQAIGAGVEVHNIDETLMRESVRLLQQQRGSVGAAQYAIPRACVVPAA